MAWRRVAWPAEVDKDREGLGGLFWEGGNKCTWCRHMRRTHRGGESDREGGDRVGHATGGVLLERDEWIGVGASLSRKGGSDRRG